MSINFNDVVRIGKDAVVRTTGTGKQVTGFSAACDSGWGDNKQTIWLDCSAWGERWAKVAPYILKGSQVQVQGELGTRDYEGKTYITVNVHDIKLVGGKPKQGANDYQRQSRPPNTECPQGDQGNGFADDTDEVPF